MRADGNADGNAPVKKGRSKTETDERKGRIEKREMREKSVTIGVPVASSSFCHLLGHIVKYVYIKKLMTLFIKREKRRCRCVNKRLNCK